MSDEDWKRIGEIRAMTFLGGSDGQPPDWMPEAKAALKVIEEAGKALVAAGLEYTVLAMDTKSIEKYLELARSGKVQAIGMMDLVIDGTVEMNRGQMTIVARIVSDAMCATVARRKGEVKN